MRAAYEAAKQQQHGGGGMQYRAQPPRSQELDSFGSGPPRQEEIPMAIRNFLDDFTTAVSEHRLSNIEDIYSKEFSKLCDQIMKRGLGSILSYINADIIS